MTPASTAPARVSVRDLVVAYGSTVAVDRVSLDLAAGELVALLGPSGCGKTSLLRAIAGFEVPAAGRVEIRGEVVAGPGCWVEPERRRVGMVFQHGALFPHLDVAANVAYGLDGDRQEVASRRAEALELVGLRGLEGRFPHQLSGGQQQRVALARALAPRPAIVLLDEPFASLDASLRERLREEMVAVLEEVGATALLVTHDQEEALSTAHRVAIMAAGRILQAGPPEDVYARPASAAVARFLGDGVLVACTVEAGRVATPLGVVSAGGSVPAGPAWLLLRPEDLELGDGEEGAPGRLERRRFFGHDRLDRVALDGGPRLQVRTLSSAPPPAGPRVRVRLRPGAAPSVLERTGEDAAVEDVFSG